MDMDNLTRLVSVLRDQDILCDEAADAIEMLMRERDAVENQCGLLLSSLEGLLYDIDMRAKANKQHPIKSIRRHYKNVPLSDGILGRARAAAAWVKAKNGGTARAALVMEPKP